MKKWQLLLWYIIMFQWEGENALSNTGVALLPGKNMLNIIPEFLGQSPTTPPTPVDLTTVIPGYFGSETSQISSTPGRESSPDPSLNSDSVYLSHDDGFNVGYPRDLYVVPQPLVGGDHELQFNVSWTPPEGPQPKEYSIEVYTLTDSSECTTLSVSDLCVMAEYVPGNASWFLVPEGFDRHLNCALKPGCEYRVKLSPYPWNENTTVETRVEVEDCVEDICSCGHVLPIPNVTANTVSVQGQTYVNVSWLLPPPQDPLSLPPKLNKSRYKISIARQLLSDLHPNPWFGNMVDDEVEAVGPVAEGDQLRWRLVSVPRAGRHSRNIKQAVKLMARVRLVDERGCSSDDGESIFDYDAEKIDKHNKTHSGGPKSPSQLQVEPQPRPVGDHELQFNVSWTPPPGPPPDDYSIEVYSLTDTQDCRSSSDMNICVYEYGISKDALWFVVPHSAPRHKYCAIKPGCAYQVNLLAHPLTGTAPSSSVVKLEECVVGVCSCAHKNQLPQPQVYVEVLEKDNELFANISWNLPLPSSPRRLPPHLSKLRYNVSLAKQMVPDSHPAPWFADIVSEVVNASGLVAAGDQLHSKLLRIERSEDRTGRGQAQPHLKARVKLFDDRECVSRNGEADVEFGSEDSVHIRTYILWSVFGGVCILAMVAVLAVSARAVKRVLNALRPAPVSCSLEPVTWFPRSTSEPTRGQTEQSPLYDHKQFTADYEETDEWEVSKSKVHLGLQIGSGAFGQVYIATLERSKGELITVAAKMPSDNATVEEIQDFLQEIKMLKTVGEHKHVIRLIGCCTRRTALPVALLEHAPRGDLLTLLQTARSRSRAARHSDSTMRIDSNGNGRPSEADTEYTSLSDSDPPLPDSKLYVNDNQSNCNDHYVAEPSLHLDSSTMRRYALQVALGMQHLEKKKITHRDLAARNILVDGAGVLKVADFGLSRTGVYVHTRCRPVPLRWLAPEAITHAKYSNRTDVWAFAVLLWEIATLGGHPYAELSNHEVPTFINAGGRLSKPARASPRLYQLMEECWAEDPMARPTFTQIVERLNRQQQLYVDLDSVFHPSEENFPLQDESSIER